MIRRGLVVAFAVILAFFGLRVPVSAAGGGFVTTSDQDLLLNGQPFTMLGFNLWRANVSFARRGPEKTGSGNSLIYRIMVRNNGEQAVALVEALSLRAPLPASSPAEWRQLLAGLAGAFDVEIPRFQLLSA